MRTDAERFELPASWRPLAYSPFPIRNSPFVPIPHSVFPIIIVVMPTIHVHLLPDLVPEEKLAGNVAVVIDVLRATTTIVHALAAGARQVIPCLSIDDARAAAASRTGEKVVLGGERQGVRIEGFDLGNSPSEYTPEAVGGRTVVFTTTNGTRAMLRCRQADHVLLAAFVNRAAVLAGNSRPSRQNVHIVCAGTGGAITREDVLVAGSLVAGSGFWL